MVWESTLGCFTTGTFGDIECMITQGFGSLFGGAEVMTVFAVMIGLFLCFYLRLSFNLSVVFMLGLTLVSTAAFAPEYLLSVGLILAACIAGWGLYRWVNR